MPNMGYVRFENTNADLQDCVDWLSEHNPKELSASEYQAFQSLIAKCRQLCEEY